MPAHPHPAQPPVNKSHLRAAILARLQEELALQIRAAKLAHDEAISEESRAENKYDTHGQEAAYLAEGQAKLAAEVDQSIALYRSIPLPNFAPDATIAVGAVIEMAPTSAPASRSASSWYFMGPRAGGLELTLDDRLLLVLTPQSPMGRQLLGQRVGGQIALPGRGPIKTLQIVGIQ